MSLLIQDPPKSNQTTLGLYVTPSEAYEMWQADPKGVTVLDVRSFEEYIFVGHPEMAKNVPLAFLRYERPADSATPAAQAPVAQAPVAPPPGFSIEPNREFVAAVRKVCSPADRILVLCGSGGRAARAVDMLAKAGFTNVYNIINGCEGEMVTDRSSADFGKSKNNGWRALGLPWGRNLDPDLLWETSKQAA
jgi:rhodanese-related sulfurtransferase